MIVDIIRVSNINVSPTIDNIGNLHVIIAEINIVMTMARCGRRQEQPTEVDGTKDAWQYYLPQEKKSSTDKGGRFRGDHQNSKKFANLPNDIDY